MLYAVKGNKQLKIDEREKKAYLALGYDIAEEKSGKLKIIEHSPSKTVPYAQYEKILKENEKLLKENEEFRAKVKELEKSKDEKK